MPKFPKVKELRLILGERLPAADARRKFEQELKGKGKLEVHIFSIDEMIRGLVESVREDMYVRRKRYADTALEMIRWIIRSGGNVCWPRDRAETDSLRK